MINKHQSFAKSSGTWNSPKAYSRKCCSSSGFPCVGVRLVYWSLRSTVTFVICFHWSLLLAFSLHFSSSSAFLRSLFTQSSHHSCGLPRFLQPSCFFVSDLFSNLSSFILTICPAHFILLLTILPTIQALVPKYEQMYILNKKIKCSGLMIFLMNFT